MSGAVPTGTEGARMDATLACAKKILDALINQDANQSMEALEIAMAAMLLAIMRAEGMAQRTVLHTVTYHLRLAFETMPTILDQLAPRLVEVQ